MESLEQEVPIGKNKIKKNITVDMKQVVGSHDILFLCLDTLRYDAAVEEEEKGTTPILNQYGAWKRCHAPGNFTYPSHHAMFAGFLPGLAEPMSLAEREILFFPKNIGMGNKVPEGAFGFDGATFIEGLERKGYETYCIGGVAFFNKRSDVGKVLPGFFKHSYWNPSFGCPVPESTKNQVEFICEKLNKIPTSQKTFWYVNVDAIHYPNAFYLEGAKKDNLETHKAALRYVDSQLGPLFQSFKDRGPTFVIVCSDHGTCYGEDGYEFHCVSHPVVYTVPYKHFFL